MNSRIFLVLALVVVGGGIFAYSYVQQDMTTPSVGENTGSPSSSQAAVEAVVSTETEVSGDAYRISDESLVRYHAQKRWLKKPTEVVDATNTDVSGTVYFDNIFYVFFCNLMPINAIVFVNKPQNLYKYVYFLTICNTFFC